MLCQRLEGVLSHSHESLHVAVSFVEVYIAELHASEIEHVVDELLQFQCISLDGFWAFAVALGQGGVGQHLFHGHEHQRERCA